MMYQERFGKTLNVVLKELDFKNIAYTIHPFSGAVEIAQQDIRPPRSKLMDEVGGMGTGSAGTHRAVKVYEDKILARGTPVLTWDDVCKIFDVSERKKISLAQASFEVVGRDKFRGEVAARFDRAEEHHHTAYCASNSVQPEIVTAPNTPRKKLVEKDGAFQTVPG